MKERTFPVSTALRLCCYCHENGLYFKQVGGVQYFWNKQADGWHFVVQLTRLNRPMDNKVIWNHEPVPDEEIEPIRIYELEAEHSPDYKHFPECTDWCMFNKEAFTEGLL